MIIPNRYNYTFYDLIENSDILFLDWTGLIDNKLCNASESEGGLTGFLEGNCLDKNISNSLSWLIPKIKNS